MTHNIELNITQSNLEQLHCSVCEDYLSCAPIHVLPDGNNLCGRCTTSSTTLAYRVPILEIMLSNATFPCVFKQYGCSTRVLFNHTTEHEAKCEYRPIPCASLPYTNCLWEGSVIQIPDHFVKKHSDLVKQDAEFKLRISQNQQGILVVVKNNCAFIVKYFYDADTSSLDYDVRYFSPNIEGDFCKIKLTNGLDRDYSIFVKGCKCDFCKIKLTNGLDRDYSIFVKGCKCVLYNSNFFTVQNVSVLDIKKFLEILNNPTSILVMLTPPNCSFKNDVVVGPFIVNHDLLASNKCSECKYLLIPPLYDYNDGIICSNCSYTSENCKPSNDKNLQSLLCEQNYPCRWRGCGFVAKSDVILSHEVECNNRIYRCVKSNCKATFDRSKLIEHLQGHNYQYFVDKLTYNMCFEKANNGNFEYTIIENENCEETVINENYAFTVLKNEFVLITHQTYFDRSSNNHILALKTSGVNPEQFTAKVHFEHDHCKCVSAEFSFNRNALLVNLSLLPSCFKMEDELSATLCIN